MLDPEAWSRVREIFDEASALPPDERTARVERRTDDPEIRAEVLSLLASFDADDDFLEARPTPPGPGPGGPDLGARVGPYRLVREIGTGGMGRVFEAERADELFEKRVAIKFIRRGMDSEAIMRRFHREREILAALEHPGIARLLDGGITATGQPWFVMELVEGLPVTEYCRTHALSVRDRIRVFRDICAAVHFAHQNLVIHRDLKPSNLLVTPTGSVKLLDFGVARLLQDRSDAGTALTEVGQRVLTPAYASPEQLAGAPVTTASDVYSLGVLLYELLTGERPFDTQGASLDEIARRVDSRQPTLPSEAVRTRALRNAGHEGRPEPGLHGTLKGDLDNIVLMAMRREPERRYASASELSQDLERFLTGFPVRARRSTTGYRLRSFIRRHRTAVAAAALVLLTIVAGGGTALWQARVAQSARALAEARFDELRDLTTTLLFEVHDAIEYLPGSTAARNLIVTRAFDHLERLAEQGADDPTLDRDVAKGYLRLGSILGNPAGASLGDLDGARTALVQAERIATRLVKADPSDLESLETKAAALRRLGDVLAWSGDIDEGVERMERSHELYRELADRSDPEVETPHLEVVIAQVKVGDLTGHPVFPNLGDREGARARYAIALELLEAPPLRDSRSWSVRRFRGLTEERLGAILRTTGEPEPALVHFSRSLEVREELAREDPDNTDALRDVAIGHRLVCEVTSEMGAPHRGIPHCREAIEGFVRLQEMDPENRQARVDTAIMRQSLAGVLAAAGVTRESMAELDKAIRLREAILLDDPADTGNREWLESLRERRAALAVR